MGSQHPPKGSPMYNRDLTIRVAVPADARTLRRLAELDSAPALPGPVLLAEQAGHGVAAMSLETGAANADPFQPSADAVRMLRLRRYQLMRQGADVAPAQLLLRRLAAGPAS
jgi:hypothetical protein